MRARVSLIALAFLTLAGVARASSPFDTPITPALLDRDATADWVDGRETSRADFLGGSAKAQWPNPVTWFLATNATTVGFGGMTFGTSPDPGLRHLRVGFTHAVGVGTILARGDVTRVAVLRADAAYPGRIANDEDWIEATRQSGHDLTLWVLPPGTKTRALRFTALGSAALESNAGHLLGAVVLYDRFANLAPDAVPLTSSHQEKAVGLIDGSYQLWFPWNNDANARATPVSAARPEWVILSWNGAVSLRGLCAVWPGFGTTEAQTFVGPPGLNPREAPESAWRTLATPTFSHGYPATLSTAWIDFGRNVTTRAIRLRFIAPVAEGGHDHMRGVTSGGRGGWLGELLALRALGDAPLPPPVSRAPERHAPIAVPFTMPAPGFATIVLEDAAGRRVRNLVADTWFSAGPQTAWWDGLDESGSLTGPHSSINTTVGAPVAPGTYAVRGLFHGPIDLRYEQSVYSPGAPPWLTGLESGKGGWLADHTSPSTVVFLPGATPRVLLASPVSEASHSVIWTDLAGHKLDGRHWLGGGWTGASHLARDPGPRAAAGVDAYAAIAWQNELRLTALHANGTSTPVFASAAGAPATAELGGFAAWNGVLVATLPKDNSALFIDAVAGRVLGRAPMPDPRGVAFDARGRLLALSGRRVLAFSRVAAPSLGAARVLVASGLEDPRALTVDGRGNIYVADWGRSHQVKVFDADGRPLRTLGAPGGAVVGPYDPRRMNRPAGLAVTSDDHLWVAEDSVAPKRVSVWTTGGAFVRAFYGPPQYGGGGTIDARDPTRFYYAGRNVGLEFALDLARGQSALRAIYWLGAPDPAAPPGEAAPETPIYVDGRQYMTDVFNSQPTGGPSIGNLWLMREGRAVRVASFGEANRWALLKMPSFRARWPAGVEPAKPAAPMLYAWSDLNADGRVTPDEVTIAPGRMGSLTIDDHLAFCTAAATTFAPDGFTAAGVPRYDAAHGRPRAGDFFWGGWASGSGQVRSLRDGWIFSSGGPVRGLRGGVQVWTYPNEWPSQHAGVFSPAPTHPGELMATTRMLPWTITPRGGDAGELVALNGDKGNVFLMTADGLFVATLFHDVREPNTAWNMANATRGMKLDDVSLDEEAFWTTDAQTADGNVYLVGGKSHSSVIRVEGLETIRRLRAPSVTITPSALAQARAFRVAAEEDRQRKMGRELMTVALRRAPPVVDGDLGDWRDASWVVVDERPGLDREQGVVEAAMAIAGDRLYLAFRSKNPPPLHNTGESAQMLFATGGALDLMLGTNAGADPQRTEAAAGDLRLVVTRARGATEATLYRPKIAGTHGAPVAFSSPWRSIHMDAVTDVSASVKLASGADGYEVSVPLATLGLVARDGLELRGDIGVLRGDGTRTLQRQYWQNKTTSTVSDIPTEATLTPQLWGRIRFVAEPR
jgi:hypothetical protein